jgi:hypothetical protein
MVKNDNRELQIALSPGSNSRRDQASDLHLALHCRYLHLIRGCIDGSDKRRFYAVLGLPPINSPQDAVRAAIVQEYRTAKK